jgi:hypothetical protein
VEVEDETSEEEIVISSGEGAEEEEEDRQLVARLLTPSASRSVPKPSFSGAETGQKRTKEKKKSTAAQGYSKQLATKAAGRKKEPEKKSDNLLRDVTIFESGSAKLIGDMMTSYESASKSPIEKAIELFDVKYAKECLGDEIYEVYDLLQQEHKATAFAVIADARQAGWLRYELTKARGC